MGHRLVAAVFALLAFAALALPHRAIAGGENFGSTHYFCTNADCHDGYYPMGNMAMDAEGNLYGVAQIGGVASGAPDVLTNGAGVVYMLTPNKNRSKWSFRVIYNFCSRTNCADGFFPSQGLIIDKQGNLYGTTTSGGTAGNGTIFILEPNDDKSVWTEYVLYHVCTVTNCPDGAGAGPLVQEPKTGTLYGTMTGGGGNTECGGSGCGTVFSLTPNQARTTWTFQTLWVFCEFCDGGQPVGPMALAPDGALYGTTLTGGHGDAGTAFRVKPHGNTAAFRVIHQFCVTRACLDGYEPTWGLTIDPKGNLFGATFNGGANGLGTIYRLKPASDGSYNFTTVYAMCAKFNCADGALPFSGVAIDKTGNLFATAYLGAGGAETGNLFELSPTANGKYKQKVLHKFCEQANCVDGASPYLTTPIVDDTGAIFGTTVWGGHTATCGSTGCGTTYYLLP